MIHRTLKITSTMPGCADLYRDGEKQEGVVAYEITQTAGDLPVCKLTYKVIHVEFDGEVLADD